MELSSIFLQVSRGSVIRNTYFPINQFVLILTTFTFIPISVPAAFIYEHIFVVKLRLKLIMF